MPDPSPVVTRPGDGQPGIPATPTPIPKPEIAADLPGGDESRVIVGDARALPFDADTFDCCVTSPPYWGLRDYGVPGQIGLERTPEEYVEQIVACFREVKRALKASGTCWVNVGDSYAVNGGPRSYGSTDGFVGRGDAPGATRTAPPGLKPKDLVGIPWRVAFALQADGWYLRSDIIWHKPNPMPESVRDRPTKAHEYVFLLSKSGRYWYDAEAIREPDSGQDHARSVLDGEPSLEPTGGLMAPHKGLRTTDGRNGKGRNARTVWTIPTAPYSGAHFATFPPELVRRCILAGCPVSGTVLDPFAGTGTVVKVAKELGRIGIGVELNPKYAEELAHERIRTQYGLGI